MDTRYIIYMCFWTCKNVIPEWPRSIFFSNNAYSHNSFYICLFIRSIIYSGMACQDFSAMHASISPSTYMFYIKLIIIIVLSYGCFPHFEFHGAHYPSGTHPPFNHEIKIIASSFFTLLLINHFPHVCFASFLLICQQYLF